MRVSIVSPFSMERSHRNHHPLYVLFGIYIDFSMDPISVWYTVGVTRYGVYSMR